MKRNVLFTLAAASATLLVNPSFAGLTNGDFESSTDFDGWTGFIGTYAIGTSGASALSGKFLKTSTESTASPGYVFSGIWQDLSASAGDTWTFTEDGLLDSISGNAFAHLKIEWLDAGEAQIPPDSVIDGAIFGGGIESNRLTSVGSTTTVMSVTGVAPAGTVSARFGAFVVAEDIASATFSADNLAVSVVPVPEPSALLGALTALSLGGLLLRRRRG